MGTEISTREIPAAATRVQGTNRVLAGLTEEEHRRLSPFLRPISLRSKQVLLRQGEPIQHVVLLNGGVCSLVKAMENGSSIEIVGLGAEGIIGTNVALGQAESAGDVIVHVASDAALVLPIDAFKAEIERCGGLADLVKRYQAAFTVQLMQTAACNAMHSAEERCCRWLLMTHDRIQRDEFPMTHELVATALGVRRPTVTLIMAALYRSGVIRHARGRVTIIDRTALEARSCECYRVVAATFRQISPAAPATAAV
jgi:CRP-like cAMP-binding protein